MLENDIKKAVDFCCNNKTTCTGCPLNSCEYECGVYLSKYIKENEPAPAATETSSKENNLHLDDNTYRRIRQAVESADQAVKGILVLYDNMSKMEQLAFDIGEIYQSMLSATNEMEELKNGDGE